MRWLPQVKCALLLPCARCTENIMQPGFETCLPVVGGTGKRDEALGEGSGWIGWVGLPLLSETIWNTGVVMPYSRQAPIWYRQ